MGANHFDVVVVGSGAAGLYACLCLPSHYRVALVTKAELKTGASDWAQGGIAAAIAPTDSPQAHYEDTLAAGAGLCDGGAVDFLVNHAPQAIAELVQFGVSFDRHGQDLALTLEAAHSQPRVLHAADTTGRAIVSTLMEQVQARANVEIFSQAIALSLNIDSVTGHCRGIQVFLNQTIETFLSRAVLLATGGGGQVFAQTTNPKVSTGDGIALAWRSGAQVRDLEFFQFHPTALTKPDVPHFLISEAVRGEGAHLLDRRGKRFAFDYHPKGELAPRDVVSRAIFQHLANTEKDPTQATVFLDLSPIEPERIQRRFPNIVRRCLQWGVDIFREPIPVAPAAHYWMGGITTDINCQTTIPGLYALGETASTGVHGANRLASNSLLECIVFARQLRNLNLPSISPNATDINQLTPMEIELDTTNDLAILNHWRSELPRLMWQTAGICRQAEALQMAIAQLAQWRAEWQRLDTSKLLADLPQGHKVKLNGSGLDEFMQLWTETHNLLDIAHLILTSALFREESRGGHYRLDFPDVQVTWQNHTVIEGTKVFLQSSQSQD
ncbi:MULTISPECIES: L-aspartate oxidase [unclassified Synechocystis]|uniref:L-aspartate oxidase n=1 Tax=unclassified Synechocystis TaxID=2640012 RepID=UPI00040CBE35|nr:MULTISPECIES: L-aspartate oxidase [unclassified Synechocystis]AIE73685.1 L-aspartate oxidase [Synechocystis sp. PCC 6714]MCT0255042.1 L-aspartate oxidase [Synechocystis sp. CS-94]